SSTGAGWRSSRLTYRAPPNTTTRTTATMARVNTVASSLARRFVTQIGSRRRDSGRTGHYERAAAAVSAPARLELGRPLVRAQGLHGIGAGGASGRQEAR